MSRLRMSGAMPPRPIHFQSLYADVSLLYSDQWTASLPDRFNPLTHCIGVWAGLTSDLDDFEKKKKQIFIDPDTNRNQFQGR
jgi:hypothetical protein